MSSYKWHSTYDRELPDSDEDKPSGKRHFPPSLERQIQMARASTEGGTATCEIDHHRYGMTFIRFCKIAPFKVGHVCTFCKKKLGLVEA